MPVINRKYNYLLSLAYVRATAHTVSARTYLTDYSFPDLRRASRFTDRDTNLFKADSRVKRQAKTAIKNVFHILKDELHDSAKKSRTRMVTVLIKPKHLCPLTYNLARLPIFTDYFKLKNLMSQIRKVLTEWHSRPLADSIESTQLGMSAYIHNHLLFSTNPNDNLYLIEAVLNTIASRYGYVAEVAPLINRHKSPVVLSASDSTASDNYQSIARFIQYIYKQYKLPVAYGNNDKARATYQRFMALDKPQQRTFIRAIEDSTHSIRLRHHASYKRYTEKRIANGLSGIRFKLNKYHVTAEQSLFTKSYRGKPQNARRTGKNWTYMEQWQRADKVARYRVQYALNRLMTLSFVFLRMLNQIVSEQYILIKVSERNGTNETYIPTTLLSRSTGVPP